MKRSEALQKLKQYLEDANVYMRNQLPEEALLEFFENNLKMVPELREVVVKAEATTWSYEGNEWEPE